MRLQRCIVYARIHTHHNLCEDIFVVNCLYCCSDHAVGCRCGTDARHLR
jgi:hypothetical protein